MMLDLQFDHATHLFNAQRYKEAERAFRDLPGQESNPKYFNNLGATLLALGRPEEAAAMQEEAVRLDPNYAHAYNNLGLARKALGLYVGALEAFGQATALDPLNVRPITNAGATHMEAGRMDEAMAAFQYAVMLQPEYAEAWSNAGMALCWGYGDRAKGIGMLRHAVLLNPALPEAHVNLALALLYDQQYDEGFYEFEWRTRSRECRPPIPGIPVWHGELLAPGQRLLIRCDQGLGDEIFYGAFIAQAARLLGPENITVQCDPRLVPLFKQSFPSLRVIARGDDVHPVAVQITTGSLGRYFPPALVEYLRAPRLVYYCKEHLELSWPRGARKIGVSWASPRATYAKAKGIPMDQFMAAFAPDDFLIDLQYDRTEQPARQLYNIPAVNYKIDITVVAGLIAECDLIVTVSNSIAHLAAAMGKPTIVLVPYGLARLFYWGHGDGVSHWYPTVVAIHQDKAGDWSSALAEVTAAIS